MAKIEITDLNCIYGSYLFNDLDDCIQDLSEDELHLQGGFIHDPDPLVPTPDYLPKFPKPY
jgi:hypothetical protein